jgi:WD40 repeat protein
MKNIIIIIALFLAFSAFAVQPEYTIQAKGAITSICIENNILYAATDMGVVEIFDWKKNKLIKEISLPIIKDFMGDEIPPKVYSIDKIINEDILIIVSQGMQGFRNVFLYDKGTINQIFNANEHKLMIKKVCFINTNEIVFATLGNEIMRFDIAKKDFLFKKHIGTSVFSDFALNNDKSKIAACDESGKIHLLNAETGEMIKDLKGQNVDNLYQVAFYNGNIIGAGQDRRASVYQTKTYSNYFLESTFIVYCVGLSEDGKTGAFADGEENHIRVFDVKSKQTKAILKGQKSTLTQIKFVDENYIISASEDPEIKIWKWR